MQKISKKNELMGRLIREEVVKTVIDLINEGTTLTMDEVALRCGVAKGTLYNYFKNKEKLLVYVHEQVVLPIRENAYKSLNEDISPKEKIHAFVDRVFTFQQEFPLYFRFIQSQRSAAEVIDERMILTVIPLVKVCQDGINRGVFMDVDPYVMAAMIFGTVVGTMESLGHRTIPVKDIDKLKKDVICLLDRIILKE